MGTSFPRSLTFCQEIPGKFKEEVVDKWGTGGNEFVFNGKEAAVIWSNDDFGDYKKLSTTDTSITSLRDKLLKKSDVDVSDVLNRIAMVKLTKKVEGASCPSSFLAVSWHGPPKNKLDEKQKVFEGLSDLLEEICKSENISSYLIGGDFNIDTLEDLTVRQNMAVEGYELSDRANKSKPAFIPYKDNFLWSSFNRDIQVSGVRIFNFVGSEDKGSDISKTDHQELDQEKTTNNTSEVLLDHDPIVGILCFLPEEP